MKIKNFNNTLFLLVSWMFLLLIIPAFLAAFVEDEGTLSSKQQYGHFFVQVFNVLRFPSHTLLFPVIIIGGPLTYFGGLIANCFFYGLVTERTVYLFTYLFKSLFGRN